MCTTLIVSTKFSIWGGGGGGGGGAAFGGGGGGGGGLHLAGSNFSYSASWVAFRDTCIQQIIRIHTC